MRSASSLRQLGIAMHNFHNDYYHLPASAIAMKEGDAEQTWRYWLLPYLG